MNWLVAGLGFISPRHIEAIRDNGDFVIASCDIDETKISKELLPFYPKYDDMILGQKKAQAVAICTPNHLHYDMIQFASRNGLEVLCEKPLALSSEQVDLLPGNAKIGVVLQLRHHPEIKKLKQQSLGKVSGSITVKVCRGPDYWSGWKGKQEKSGGILFNLGIHYFDLLIHLFGDEYKILESKYGEKLATGKIDFKDSVFDYHLEIMDDTKGQDRRLKLNGRDVSLSKLDNLSFEGLHKKVYRDFKKGKIVTPQEANKSIKLIEKLCS